MIEGIPNWLTIPLLIVGITIGCVIIGAGLSIFAGPAESPIPEDPAAGLTQHRPKS